MHRRTRAVVVLSAAVTVAVGTIVPAAGSAAYPHPVSRRYVATAKTHAPTHSSNHWKLAYRATFDHQLNTTSAWDVYSVGGSSNPDTEWFSQKHVTVSGGQLHIKGYVDRNVMPDGRVVTGGLGLWNRATRYGKYEMLVRMQPCNDVKYAWMLWPYSNRWPQDGDIDFAEDEGGNRKATTASIVYAGSAGQERTLSRDVATPAGGLGAWHVIGVQWTPEAVRYTMDGAFWGGKQTTHIPHTPMVMVMQTEGIVSPSKVNLPGGSCNADIGWVVQWKYHA